MPSDEACLVAAQTVRIDEELAPADADHDRRLASTQGLHHRVGGEPGDTGIDAEQQGWSGVDAAIRLQPGLDAGEAVEGGQDPARLVEMTRPLGVVILLEKQLEGGDEPD